MAKTMALIALNISSLDHRLLFFTTAQCDIKFAYIKENSMCNHVAANKDKDAHVVFCFMNGRVVYLFIWYFLQPEFDNSESKLSYIYVQVKSLFPYNDPLCLWLTPPQVTWQRL